MLGTARNTGYLTRLTWSLGNGLGEYLLQQIDWVLQDTDTLYGSHRLESVLTRRLKTSFEAAQVPTQSGTLDSSSRSEESCQSSANCAPL